MLRHAGDRDFAQRRANLFRRFYILEPLAEGVAQTMHTDEFELRRPSGIRKRGADRRVNGSELHDRIGESAWVVLDLPGKPRQGIKTPKHVIDRMREGAGQTQGVGRDAEVKYKHFEGLRRSVNVDWNPGTVDIHVKRLKGLLAAAINKSLDQRNPTVRAGMSNE